MKVKLLLIFIPLVFSINVLAQAPPWHWAKQGATGGTEMALDVTTDATSTDIYVGGSFDGNLNSVYGSSLSASLGQLDGFVLKYDALGNIIWAFKIGSAGNDEVRGVATDPFGNVYTLGSFNGTCDFDPSPASFTLTSNSRDGFLAKYTSSGVFQWAVKFGSAGLDDASSIYADVNGVYITGYFTGIAGFNSTSGLPDVESSEGDEDLFGAKYSFSGMVQWVITQGDSKTDMGNEVIADNNNVYFIGTYAQNCNLFNATGPNPVMSLVSEQNQKSAVVVSAYSQAGVLQWANNITSTDDNVGLGLAQDATDIYITGSITNSAHFKYPSPTFTVTASGSSTDIFLAKLPKSSGLFTWVSSQTGSGSGNEAGYDLEVNFNTLVLLGAYAGSLNYQPFGGPLLSANNSKPFLTCFDLSGNYLWAAQTGGNGPDLPTGLDLNLIGGIFICGGYSSSGISFGNINLTGASNTNIFVAKIGCDSILVNTVNPFTQTICTGNTPSQIAGAVSAGPNYNIQWQSSSDAINWTNATGTSTNLAYASPSLTSSTYFRRVISAIPSCTNYANSAFVQVNVDQYPLSNAGSTQSVCVTTGSANLAASSPTPGAGLWSVVSGSATVISPTLATTGVTGLGSGTTVLQWAVISGVCPAVTSTVMIDAINPVSQAVAGGNQRLCADTASLSATLPLSGTGTWSQLGGSGSIASPAFANTTVSGLGTGTNSLLWTVSNGICASSYDTVFIIVDAPITAFANAAQTVCASSVIMRANSPAPGKGSWQLVSGSGRFSDSTLNTTVIDSLVAGQNVFRWTVVNGVCPSSSDQVVIWRDLPPDSVFAGINQQVEIPAAQLSANIPTAGFGYWQVVQGNGVFDNDTSAATRISGLTPGNNLLRWSVKKGVCPARSSDLTIYLEPLKIPTGFSPNGDGINDTYVIPGVDYYDNASFSVFNRWGSLVYHTASYKNEWDGSNMNHEPLVDDTYYFTLKVTADMNFSGYIIIKSTK